MSITRYLLFPLLCLGLVVTGCPQSGGGGGGGAGDDDDDDLPTDDDDASDDDDAVQEIPCDGTAATGAETEPNDTGAGANEFDAGGDWSITGTLEECGNDGEDWTAAPDWFKGDWADCMATATVELAWTGTDDLDVLIFGSEDDSKTGVVKANLSATDPGLESGPALIEGPAFFKVMCWEGTGGTDYTLTVTF